MIRLKGNAGTGNVMNAVRHARAVFSEIRKLETMREDEIFAYAKELRVPVELVEQVRANGRLPVVTFAAGGLATPADVAMLMELGVDGVFVGSGIFKGENPAARARDGGGVHPLQQPGDGRARLDRPRQGDGRPPRERAGAGRRRRPPLERPHRHRQRRLGLSAQRVAGAAAAGPGARRWAGGGVV